MSWGPQRTSIPWLVLASLRHNLANSQLQVGLCSYVQHRGSRMGRRMRSQHVIVQTHHSLGERRSESLEGIRGDVGKPTTENSLRVSAFCQHILTPSASPFPSLHPRPPSPSTLLRSSPLQKPSVILFNQSSSLRFLCAYAQTIGKMRESGKSTLESSV